VGTPASPVDGSVGIITGVRVGVAVTVKLAAAVALAETAASAVGSDVVVVATGELPPPVPPPDGVGGFVGFTEGVTVDAGTLVPVAELSGVGVSVGGWGIVPAGVFDGVDVGG
jgi:hypothetical protein